MRRLCVNFSLGLLFSLLALPAWAVHSRERQSILTIYQEAGRVYTESPSGRVIDTKKLAEKMKYEVDPGESLGVQIADPNPLVYTYTWKLIPKTPTANSTAISGFVESIRALIGLLPRASTLAVAREVGGQPPSPEKQMQEALENYSLLLDELAKKASVIPVLTQRSVEGSAEAEVVKQEGKVAKDLLLSIETEQKRIKEVEPKLLQKASEQKTVESSRLLSTLAEIKQRDSEIQGLIAALKSFSDLAVQIHVPIVLDPPIAFDPTQDGGVKLVIGVQDNKDAKMAEAKATTKGRPGTYEFAVTPYSPVDFAVGPAAIYSFIELQNYSTATANGKTTIVRKDSGDQVNGLTVGAMLSITPRAWSNPAFHGSIQVGASPTKDKVGLFLGGAVRFFDQISLGGGVAYQQAQRLAPGLTVGQEIASADKLKTNTVFKSGFYLTVTLDFGANKK